MHVVVVVVVVVVRSCSGSVALVARSVVQCRRQHS